MTERGKLIVLEGGDGVGKSTTLRELASIIRRDGKRMITVEEPDSAYDENGTELVPTATELRGIIKDKKFGRSALTNVLLFNASRRENLLQAIEPALTDGIWVGEARNYLSTVVYQGYGEGWNINEIERMVLEATSEAYMNPDFTFILDVDENERARRLATRDSKSSLDTFESMPTDFQIRVGEGYRQLARDKNIPLISAAPAPTDVAQEIWDRIKAGST